MKQIDFYFDFLSPYSFLAWQKVKKMQSAEIEWRYYPVVLGQVIHSFNVKGPAEIRPKREYLFRDCLRKAVVENVVFNTPVRLPFNSISLLRIALTSVAKEQQLKIIDAIYCAVWQERIDPEDDLQLTEFFKVKGLDYANYLELSQTSIARAELKANMKKALDHKIFGLPSFIIDGELFWGNDSVCFLQASLDGCDNYNKNEYKKFLELSEKMGG